MTKANNVVVSVTDNATRESYVVEANQLPRQTEPGVYLYLKINQKGMAELREKGLTLRSTDDLENVWCASTGMSKAGLGKLGNWSSAEDKANFTVTVGGVPFVGKIGKSSEAESSAIGGAVGVAAIADATPVQKIVIGVPQVAMAPKPSGRPPNAVTVAQVVPQMVAPTATLSKKDAHNVESIKQAITAKYPQATIMAQLTAKVGADKANQLWQAATQVVAPVSGFSFK